MLGSFKKQIKTLVGLLVFLAFLLTPFSAAAQNSAGLTLAVQAGFNGYCRSREWMPVQITLDNTGPLVEGRLEILQSPVQTSPVVYAGDVSLPNPAHKVVTLFIYADGYLDSLSVRLVKNGGQVLANATAKLICLSPNDRLYGILSDRPDTFNILSQITRENGHTYLARLTAKDITINPDGLAALDMLVFSDFDSGVLSPDQQSSLLSWVTRGGRMLVTGGLDWKRTTAGLAALVPVRPVDTQAVDNLGALAKFAGRQDALVKNTDLAQGSLLKAGTQVLLTQDNIPLVLNHAQGWGEVDFLAFDPALEPFAGWAGRLDFYHKLIDVDLVRPVWGWGIQDWDAARQAVHTLAGDTEPNLFAIIGFILVYVIVIGPINYILLKRLKKTILAWITIPGLVLLFTAAAFIAGRLGIESRPVLNRLAIVQISPDNAQAHLDGLAGIISPVQSSYSLDVGNGMTAHPLPKGSRQGDLAPDHPWLFDSNPAGGMLVDSIPVDPSGFEAVALEGNLPAPDIHGDAALQLTGKNGTLSGSVTNNSDISLSDVVLLTPWGSQKMDALAAHASRNFQYLINPEGVPAARLGTTGSENASTLNLFITPQKTLADEIMGPVSGNSSPSTDQRMALLSAFGNVEGRQGKIYVAGWSSSSPMDIKLDGQDTSGQASTLYFVTISTKTNTVADPTVFSPAMFSWQVIHNSGLFNPAPYNVYLGQGSVIFDFKPVIKASFKSVESLTLHLDGGDANGSVPFTLSLLDWGTNQWTPAKNVVWGDVVVAQPEHFVNPDGEVNMRIDSSDVDAPFLKKADFTLVVHP